jgi:antitoxin ChpS
MKLRILKWGSSAAIKIPSSMLIQIGATIGDTVEVDISAFSIVKRKYKLADLLAECDANAPPPKMTEWDEMPAVGKEYF